MLAEKHLTEFELAQLATLNPGEVEEARALIPSLEVGAAGRRGPLRGRLAASRGLLWAVALPGRRTSCVAARAG